MSLAISNDGCFRGVRSLFGWLLAGGLSAALIGTRPAAAGCALLPEPQAFNRAVVGEVIVIGRLSERPYWVIIPGEDVVTLSAVRACATDAFISRSRLGDYLQVGAFARRSEAEQLVRAFRRGGFRARVIYAH